LFTVSGHSGQTFQDGARTSSRAPCPLEETLIPSDNLQAIEIHSHLSRLFKLDELVEYRALLWGGGGRGLYFTDLERLAVVVAMLDQDPRVQSSYVVINPLKGRLIRERKLIVNPTDEQVEQVISGPGGQTARDEDIDMLRWMFVDVDTIRVPHLKETDKGEFDRLQHECSTNEEKARARVVAQKVLKFLEEKGWPQPILCDSGNGFHILFRVNLQNNPTNVHHIADCLKALKAEFASEPDADIDASVYNPARLTRAYGSTTRKGTDMPERPYRRNRIFEMKQPVGDVTLDMILFLATASPGYSKHNDGDLPELDPSFDPNDWIEHFVRQHAFSIEGEKEWQGNPILATDFCLFAGRKHSGDEYKSGFIIGDTFGYKCFSDDCEGKTIKDIYKWLREAVNDDGSPRFIPYDKPIYKTETVEELLETFGAEDISLTDKVEPTPIDPLEPEPMEPDKADGKKKRLKIGRIKDLVGWMIGAILRDPVGVLSKFRLLKSHIDFSLKEFVEIENRQIWLIDSPMRQALTCVLAYFEELNLLPNKGELLNWMDESSYVIARKVRKLDDFSDIRAYITDLQDDPTKEFAPMAAELDRAIELVSQRLVTKRDHDKYLKTGSEEDAQAFRIAQRKHAQKKLYSSGDILPGPIQLMTDKLDEEFRKYFDGANDAEKFETGFAAIDNNSLIGLGPGRERLIYIYGGNSNFKTTMLVTIAINAAKRGKNGLILIGEHEALSMMQTLILMLGHYVKDNPEIGQLPSRTDLENRRVTEEDWRRIRRLLDKVHDYEILPGHLGVQNINAIAQNNEDRLGTVVDYIHTFNADYPLDFVVIDPLSQLMPLGAMGKKEGWGYGTELLMAVRTLSHEFEGRGQGLMVLMAAQFGVEYQREVEKMQAKNAAGMDQHDDKLIELLSQPSRVEFFTTISHFFDLGIGIVTRVKNGRDGYLVKGRARFLNTFQSVSFTADPVSNVIVEGKYPTVSVGGSSAPPGSNPGRPEATMGAIDEL